MPGCGSLLPPAWTSCFLIVSSTLWAVASLSDGRAAEKHQPPKWPAQYKVSWSLAVPYVTRIQSTPLVYNYTVFQDSLNGRQLSTRDGVESVLELIDTNTMYNIYPKVDTWACRAMDIAGGGGPTAQQSRRHLLSSEPELTLVLPDLTDGRWAYNGSQRLAAGVHAGADADAYVWLLTEDYGYGKVVASYTFFVDQKGAPLRLDMWGVNLYTGGHFDRYIADYYGFEPGPAPANTYAIPEYCPQHPTALASYVARHQLAQSSLLRHLYAMLPNLHHGDAAYDAFVHRHGRRHRTPEEYQGRRQVFHDNLHLVDSHNAGNYSHRLELNHFGDWTHEEFLAVMLPNHGRPRRNDSASELRRRHERTVAPHLVPKTLDWRGTGADSPVKDQAMCGGCWAFGAIASLEAAYFRGTGKQLLMSEQFLMDCGWDTGNTACMGGFQDLAFQFVLPHGGIPSEEAYPYQGVTNFCNKDAPMAATFKVQGTYVEVTGGEEELKEALYTKGPMTVSVDAGPEAMRFYKSGVFKDSKCETQLDKLDHAVIVSGYGTTEEGEDFWLVKNTWSTNWGEEGYIRLSRHPDDCGIASQPIYIDFDSVH